MRGTIINTSDSQSCGSGFSNNPFVHHETGEEVPYACSQNTHVATYSHPEGQLVGAIRVKKDSSIP